MKWIIVVNLLSVYPDSLIYDQGLVFEEYKNCTEISKILENAYNSTIATPFAYKFSCKTINEKQLDLIQRGLLRSFPTERRIQG